MTTNGTGYIISGILWRLSSQCWGFCLCDWAVTIATRLVVLMSLHYNHHDQYSRQYHRQFFSNTN
ncbi:MAG: hypothetical protein IPI53_11950 [Saprospiraceae bacterium]|nr:hypothetical protein [Saprospiraceae bacterium]